MAIYLLPNRRVLTLQRGRDTSCRLGREELRVLLRTFLSPTADKSASYRFE